MFRAWGLVLAVLATATAACTEGPSTSQQPTAASSAAAVPTATQRLPLPSGDLLARRIGSGSQNLGEIDVTQPSSLYFRCTLGEGAVLKYGAGSQPCPDENGKISIAVEPMGDPIPLSVEAPANVEWEVSAATGG